ncbi:amidohydrolase family protein [Undibacterium cyanobacteriorum]|uniref:Amidohydrolase family protein n=1 Tax=Undibacterium cyanobacteriorum TaxID=3073561 RepID=A0ABY9RDR4_9BURK|nr:amidohydrolase family protein [Undibacterium sp. 20NA77.5]WMW79352.1 amidohydrolase family protein [Undibacterium sp. 20NA77.5]
MQGPWRLMPLATLVLGTVSMVSLSAQAQTSTSRVEGLRENNPSWHALTGARVVTAPGKVVENGTVVLREGVIVSVTPNGPIPAGARVWKLDGRTIYPGFIDMVSAIGVPSSLAASAPAAPGRPSAPRVFSGRSIAADNPRIHPEQDVSKLIEVKADEVKLYRELGFTTVLATPAAGIFRGQSALLSLNSTDNPKNMVLSTRVAQHMANELESGGRGYPGSLMGVIAQVRQTFYDAQWYQRAGESKLKIERPQINDSLEALKPVLAGRQSIIYATDNEQAYQRVAKIRDEFGLKVILQGNGFEYRRANQLKATGMPVIVPLAFPNAPEVEHPDMVLDTALESLQHWEQAPSNLAYIEKAGIEFAVTPAGLKDPKKDFWNRLRQAIRRGLSIDQALASLTTVPAKLIGEQKRLGTIAPGQLANLVVASGDLFSDDKANIEINFVEGKPLTTENYNRFELRGTWTVTSGGKTSTWVIEGSSAKPSLKVDGANVELSLKDSQLLAKFSDKTGSYIVVADGRGDHLNGTIQDPQAKVWQWTATRSKAASTDTTPAKAENMPVAWSGNYPAGPYAMATPAKPSAILVKNATIWTSAKAGKLEQSDMLVVDGKIAAIGKDLKVPANALVIDATGKHVSPGIVDAHSHTAMMQGINEATSSITAEVRVGDIIDASSINIYRQLAGGVTTANVLHGSANTIGGQNQVIKLRWGADAEGLKLDGAFPGIKFALGENVKQANWGNESTGRYPQTRMGVEQILRSAFLAARAYKEEREAWKKSPSSMLEPRRDLQMDTLVELLDRKRMIHIHSYRQDEILMFARVAQEFNLLVGTFQHVMEGYKVADVIASLGAGGSTFSDWWGYKMEVSDSVPFNGALMHNAGVVTSFNSDSDELARHLNTEAAKAVKYGGLSDTEALKFVTLNPAKQLKIDQRTGSLEVGKDADFVIWNTSPLSTFSHAEQTWIEGRKYFDRGADQLARDEAKAERTRIAAKVVASRNPSPVSSAKPNDADKVVAPKTPAEMLAANLAYLELKQWLHMMSKHRTAYWAGEEEHECTENE